jgi:hypothetical protein
VLDLVGGVLAFDVLKFLVDNQILLTIDLHDLHLDDVRRLPNDIAERHGRLDVGAPRRRKDEDEPQSGPGRDHASRKPTLRHRGNSRLG